MNSKSAQQHIILLGCGKMGSALLRGWLQDETLQASFTIIEPFDAAVEWLPERDTIQRFLSVADAKAANLAPADFVLLAVKPQMMEAAASDLQMIGHERTAYLSIAAGLSCAWLAGRLGDKAPILRSMPNTPASVGKGVTALYVNAFVDNSQSEMATKLLSAVGDVVSLPDEHLMDAVTALSGSGPAYIFLMAEVMAAAGMQLGLPEELAHHLARQTIAGAGTLLDVSEESASILRENVTSKGGTTAAALSVLQDNDALAILMARAMKAAHERSIELGG